MSTQHYPSPDVESESTIKERTREDSWELLNNIAHIYFDLSGEDLLRRWDAGEYTDQQDDWRVEYMTLMLRLMRDEL